MFQLTEEEFKNLMFHFGASSWGGTRKLPRAVTEQGVAMLSKKMKSRFAPFTKAEFTPLGDNFLRGRLIREREIET